MHRAEPSWACHIPAAVSTVLAWQKCLGRRFQRSECLIQIPNSSVISDLTSSSRQGRYSCTSTQISKRFSILTWISGDSAAWEGHGIGIPLSYPVSRAVRYHCVDWRSTRLGLTRTLLILGTLARNDSYLFPSNLVPERWHTASRDSEFSSRGTLNERELMWNTLIFDEPETPPKVSYLLKKNNSLMEQPGRDSRSSVSQVKGENFLVLVPALTHPFASILSLLFEATTFSGLWHI